MKNAIKELWWCMFPPLDIRIAELQSKVNHLEYYIEDSDDLEWDHRMELVKLRKKLDKLKAKRDGLRR